MERNRTLDYVKRKRIDPNVTLVARRNAIKIPESDFLRLLRDATSKRSEASSEWKISETIFLYLRGKVFQKAKKLIFYNQIEERSKYYDEREVAYHFSPDLISIPEAKPLKTLDTKTGKPLDAELVISFKEWWDEKRFLARTRHHPRSTAIFLSIAIERKKVGVFALHYGAYGSRDLFFTPKIPLKKRHDLGRLQSRTVTFDDLQCFDEVLENVVSTSPVSSK